MGLDAATLVARRNAQNSVGTGFRSWCEELDGKSEEGHEDHQAQVARKGKDGGGHEEKKRCPNAESGADKRAPSAVPAAAATYIPGMCFVGASPFQRSHFTQQTPSMDIKVPETEKVMLYPDRSTLFPDHIGPSAKVVRGNVRLHLIPSQGPEAQLGVECFRHDARFQKAG